MRHQGTLLEWDDTMRSEDSKYPLPLQWNPELTENTDVFLMHVYNSALNMYNSLES